MYYRRSLAEGSELSPNLFNVVVDSLDRRIPLPRFEYADDFKFAYNFTIISQATGQAEIDRVYMQSAGPMSLVCLYH